MLLTQSRLSHRASEHLLRGLVDPVSRERVDDFAPKTLLRTV
jgi:hypothetical protein